MENKRLSKVRLGQISEETWPNILSRLPVKSLLRFRCVSKSWLSLISNADFHLLHRNNNRDKTRLLVVQDLRKSCVLRCSDTFEAEIDLCVDLPDDCEVECCVDGLVLLSRSPDALEAWNPSLQKVHEFAPLPDIKIIPDAIKLVFVDIGLGYDASSKDYKHVRFIFRSDDETLHTIAIYSIRAESWKIIQPQDHGFPDWQVNLRSWKEKSVYLRGSLYFIAIGEEDRDILVSIDLSSGVLCRTSFPDDVHCENDTPLRLVDKGRSIAFFETEYRSMWVWECFGAESECMCWTKRYSFGDLSVHHVLHINKNNEMLIQWKEKGTFKLAGGKGVNHFWLIVTSYNLQTQEEKILLQNLQQDCSTLEHLICAVYDYVENCCNDLRMVWESDCVYCLSMFICLSIFLLNFM